jgi:hypothetical protein
MMRVASLVAVLDSTAVSTAHAKSNLCNRYFFELDADLWQRLSSQLG